MNIDQSISTPVSPAKGEKLDPARKIKLEKAVREFESVLVGYMLKSMRNTVEKTDNSNENFGADMFEGMFDVELARHISKNSNLGLAEMLYRKMTGEEMPGIRRPDTPGASPAGHPVRSTQQAGVTRQVSDASDVPGNLDERLQKFDSYIAEASGKFGVSDSLIRAVIVAESSARPDAQSKKNAKGLMQLIDSTASDMGVGNVWDPRENILGGSKYLRQLLDKFDGDEELAIASYNAGPAAVEKYGGVPPYRETKEYVGRVMKYLKAFDQRGSDEE